MSRTTSQRRTALVLLLLAVILLLFLARREPPPARANELRDQLIGATAPTNRQAQWQQLREEIARLSPRQRQEFWAERRKEFRAWLADLFQAPPDERAARLDEEIDRMQTFRRQGQSSDGGPSAGGPMPTPQQLDLRSRQWLDATTPEERVMVALYFQMLAQRQQQLGQPACSSPWGDEST
jgi:hypothetical protein